MQNLQCKSSKTSIMPILTVNWSFQGQTFCVEDESAEEVAFHS